MAAEIDAGAVLRQADRVLALLSHGLTAASTPVLLDALGHLRDLALATTPSARELHDTLVRSAARRLPDRGLRLRAERLLIGDGDLARLLDAHRRDPSDPTVVLQAGRALARAGARERATQLLDRLAHGGHREAAAARAARAAWDRQADGADGTDGAEGATAWRR